MSNDDTINIKLSDIEIQMLILALSTSEEYLKSLKSTLGGVIVGHTKIDTTCVDINKLRKKLSEKIGERS